MKLVRIDDANDAALDCLRREVAVLLHTTGECKQVSGAHRALCCLFCAAGRNAPTRSTHNQPANV